MIKTEPRYIHIGYHLVDPKINKVERERPKYEQMKKKSTGAIYCLLYSLKIKETQNYLLLRKNELQQNIHAHRYSYD